MTSYNIQFINSLKGSTSSVKLPSETISIIKEIDNELSKYFKFLLEKNKNNNYNNNYTKNNKYNNYKKDKINNNSNNSSNNSNNDIKNWREKPKRAQLFKRDEEDKYDEDKRNINLTLNKINDMNFDKLSLMIIDKSKTEELLSYVIENSFQKAVYQPSYCDTYVKLYKELIKNKDVNIDIIKNTIIDKCNNYVELFNQNSYLEDDKNIENEYDLLCEINKKKEYIRGYSQFIGVLFMNNLIGIKMIQQFINLILETIYKQKSIKSYAEYIDENINSLYIIIKTIGKDNTNKLTDYQENLKSYQELKKDKELSSKTRFKCMDILDLLK